MTNQSTVAKRFLFKKIFATVCAALLILLIFSSTAFASVFKQYDVKIIDSGKETVLTTTETEPIEILKKAGITIHSNDKINLDSFEKGEGGTIVINRLNAIRVEIDGKIKSYNVYASTVGEALSEIGVEVDEKDVISCSLSDEVQNEELIKIKPAFTVSLISDGKTTEYKIAEGRVFDLIKLSGITLGPDDYTEPSSDSELKADMKVKVFRVEYREETKEEKIKYSTTTKKDKSSKKGKRTVIIKGVNGVKNVTYKVKYVNGEENSREKIFEEVKRQAVTEVVKVGTKKKKTSDSVKSNGVKSKNGYSVGQKISGKYSHYCACATCNGNARGVTSSGKRIHNGMPNPYYVACNWLPLGSVIKIDGKNYTVVDRGGSGLSKKGKIDIFTPEGHSACYKYGTGSCTIEIVRLGW